MKSEQSDKNRTILIVEDDSGIAELECQRLEPLGFALKRCTSHEEAVETLKTSTPELMLLDYSLPGMTALELIGTLNKNSIKIPPFVMVTGRGDEKVAVQAMQAGALDYIVKDGAFLDNILTMAKRALEKAGLLADLKSADEARRKNLLLYNFLAQVNQAAIRLKDREKLYSEICQIAVKAGGFRMAWVGLPDTDIGRITPAFKAGIVDGYLDSVKISISEGETSKEPTATAFNSGRIITATNIAADPIMAPWRDRALKRGYRSSAAIPLSENGRTTAVLNLYSGEDSFFSEEESILLAEIQGDVSLALDGISSEERRYASQAALERTSAELTHLMETTQVILLRLRVSGDRLVPGWISGDAISITGYDAAEMLTPDWFDKTIHPEDKAQTIKGMKAVFEKGILVRDFRLIHKNGSIVWIHEQLKTYGKDNSEVLGSWTDLTDMLEAKRKEQRMITEMAAMQRVESLGQLAGGIAHDFNNMLTGIMANISLLERRCSGDKENVEIIKETLEAARNAQSLTASLLAFAKGGKPVKKELCLEKTLADMFILATRGSSAACETEIPGDLWSIDGDESQLKQAINNLLINGLQAMPSGGRLKLKAENLAAGAPLPEILPKGNYVRLTISDLGIGIPAQYLRHIFEPYFSTKTKGHGLGLSMTWSVVRNHGGHITAASTPGKGTVFEVYLPSTGRCIKGDAEQSREIIKGTGRILVLEDDEVVIGAMRRMLRELGYKCEIVNDGKDAVRLYREEKEKGAAFDAVIMDLTIPGGMGGKEAVAELRKFAPEAKVIVSSGYSDEAVMSDHENNGFDAVLPKPYKFEELADTLAKLLKA